MEIIQKSRGSEIQRHQQRIFLYWHSKNTAQRDILIHDLLSQDAGADCVVSWIKEPDKIIDEIILEQELHETAVMVLIVSQELLDQAKIKESIELHIAKKLKLPIMPIAIDSGLFPKFTKQMGAVHGLSLTDDEYHIKLKSQLDNFIISDELINKIIKNAFTRQIFLSYRKKDIIEARRFMKTFHDIPNFESTAIWYDNFLTAGRVFDDEIRVSIDKADAFILLVTPNITEPGNYVLIEEYPYAVKKGKKIIAVEVVPTDTKIFQEAYEDIKLYVPLRKLKDMLFEMFPEKENEFKMESEQTYLLGMAYIRGIATEKNVERGISILEKTAIMNDLSGCDAAVALGEHYHNTIPADYKKALKWFFRAAEINENVHGKNSPDLAGIYNYIGSVYRNMGEKKESLIWAEKSLKIEEGFREKNHWRIAVAYNNIGSTYNQIGQHKTALPLLERSLKIMDEINLEYPYKNAVYNNIGSAHKELKNNETALIFYKKALEICLKAVGEEHQDTAVVYNNLGFVYYSIDEFEKGMELWNKALLINESVIGLEHPRTVMTRTTIERYKNFEKIIPPSDSKKIFRIALIFWTVVSALLWWWAFGGETVKKGVIVFASICTLFAIVSLLLNIPSNSNKKK